MANGVIEIHTILEGCGSEYLGDWRVEVDWGVETDDKNRYTPGFQPLSIKLLENLYEARTGR